MKGCSKYMGLSTAQGVFVRPDSVLKQGQRLEISLPDDDGTFVSTVEEIGDGNLVLAVPFDKDRCPVMVSTGTNVICSFFDGYSHYKFDVEILRKVRENILVWHTDKPEKVQKIQKREFVRVKTSQPLVVRLPHVEEISESMLFGNSVDLSGGGICILLDRPLEIGSSVSVELDNIPGIGLFNVAVTVVRCVEFEEKGNKEYHVGAKFNHINPKIQDKLVNYIFDLQRKSSHNVKH